MGRRHRPFYRLNAVEKRTPRDGRVLETLGWYNPVERAEDKQLSLNADRIKFWLERGAQATPTVNDLLAREEIIDADAWRAERERKRAKNYTAAIEKKQAEEAAKRAEEEAKRKEEEEKKAAEATAAEAESGGSDADAAGENAES
jgi:small subunit ribosomal protein S16